MKKKKRPSAATMTPEQSAPDWNKKCETCGQSPVVPLTGMCGPCTFGDASTAGGKW